MTGRPCSGRSPLGLTHQAGDHNEAHEADERGGDEIRKRTSPSHRQTRRFNRQKITDITRSANIKTRPMAGLGQAQATTATAFRTNANP